MAAWRARLHAVPWLASGFRPFYLLGALYAPLLAIGAGAAYLGVVDLRGGALVLWHGHEMVFGFASAIVIGTLLTALPSWADTPEMRGPTLALLALTWLVGRVAFWASPWLDPLAVALADLLLWPCFLGLLAGPLWQVPNRLYRLLLPIGGTLALANLTYHLAVFSGRPETAGEALRAAVWALLILFTLKGGLLTPIFTGNALRELGRGAQAPFRMPLEVAALAALVALAVADLSAAPRQLSGGLAALCAVLQGGRALRWRGWRVADQPLLPAMHLSFAWLVVALALKAAADLSGRVPATAWLHAFTVGALGLMMLALMTRVALRHTGRPLGAPRVMRAAAVAVFVAAALRLVAGVAALGPGVMALAVALWAAAFAAYLWRFGAVLVTPSLPRPS